MRRLFTQLSSLALVLTGTGAAARPLPNYEAIQDVKPMFRTGAGFQPAAGMNPRVAHMDERRGQPSFVWVHKGDATPQRAQFTRMAPEKAALAQLEEHAPLYGLRSFQNTGAKVTSVSRNTQGVTVVTLAQDVDGVEVFRQSLKLLLNAHNELVAISGALSPHVSSTTSAARTRFSLDAASAIARAYEDLTGQALDASLLTAMGRAQADDGLYTHYQLASYARPLAEGLIVPARARRVLYPMPDALVPAYYLELNTGSMKSTESDYYAYVVSAVDGQLLSRINLTAHADFSYRAWADTTPPYTPKDGPSGNSSTPHPTGVPGTYTAPGFEPRSLITLQNIPFSRNDPWLPAGAVETTGNNVDAYADLSEPDGFNAGDLRPGVTAPGVFDFSFDATIQPSANATQIAAATTQLFFVNNWLHDWFYDSGFDEASGNAQSSNFGRGGREKDPIAAQAQDYSGRNNANMSTPADGASPRMQMYLFDGRQNAKLTAHAPASVAGDYTVGVAGAFGPQVFDTTGDVVVAQDDTAPASDGCTPLVNGAEVTGKIALIDRGSCDFTIKVTNAQNAGAIGVIIADNVAGPAVGLGGASTTITIPTLRITLADGNKLRATIPGLSVSLKRAAVLDLDGTVDNAIVAHEWGHYISNRLVQNSAGLTNNQGRSMGEGWGDFHSLLMVVRAEDINVATNANWSGVYGMAEYATRGSSQDSTYFGIRRVGYSTDMTKNALTFRHIANGQALPTTAPIVVNSNANSQFHNSGEIWATMLWECYASLLRAHPFADAQARMKSYLVNGYKMTPAAPTYLEARDAVIASAYANDPADGERLWRAFAKRGAGVGAVAPDRLSTTHVGVVESYAVGADLAIVSISLADDVDATSCDHDGILDNGETGRLRIVVRNSGSQPATRASATVFSGSKGVTVGNGGTVAIPTIPVGGTAEAFIPVSLNGASTAQRLDFSVAARDEQQAIPGDRTASLATRGNYNESPASSAKETVDAQTPPWTFENDPTLSASNFRVVRPAADLNGYFFGPNEGAPTDLRLITPALNVGTAAFTVTFRHAYDFEQDTTVTPADYYDGAVIELTQDDGQTWVDIGTSLYKGALYNDDASYPSNRNPLKGRQAIVGQSAGFPALTTATLNLGTTYAGKTVRIRFRIGTDNGAAANGWLLDDLDFGGLTNKPFTTLVAQPASCVTSRPPVVSAGANKTVDERTAVTLTGSAYSPTNKPLTYAWTQKSGPSVTLSGANTLTASFTAPDVAADTDLVFELSASDGTASATSSVTVRVLNLNRAPSVNAGLDALVDERAAVTLMGSASDEDGDPLTYRWFQTAGTPVALRGATSLSASFTAPEVSSSETLTFTLWVSDGKTSATDSVNVVVQNVNRAPELLVLDVTADERTTIHLDAIGYDTDGDTLSYAWTQKSGPTVTLAGQNTAHASFEAGEVSADTEFTFEVSVNDGTASATTTVKVLVRNVNRAPTAVAGDGATVNSGATFQLNGGASSDPDGDALSYEWTQVGGPWATIEGANTATPSITAPTLTADAELRFSLVVKDGSLSSAASIVSVTVKGTPPTGGGSGGDKGGCSATGAGAPMSLLGLGLLGLLRRRRMN
ncbi:myxosortase-dependent M36 family metallopeptidase [Archangium primigenium]|uniref:myxosortase-dependent M36 family metallopeptidase n=1 Tax=[Archangium] primigenium TaxID=2792470 RepID=UPI003083F4A8